MEDLLGKFIGFFQKGASGIDAVASGQLTTIAASEAYQVFLFWANIIWWFFVATVVIVFVWHFYLRYNKKVMVKTLKGTAIIDVCMDRGRIHKDKRGKRKISLLKTRKTAPIPTHQYTLKMGKKDFYEFYLCDDGSLRPAEEIIDYIDKIKEKVSITQNISNQEVAGWNLEEMKLEEERYKKQGFLQKHLPEIMVFLGMVAAVAIIWITISKIQNGQLENARALYEVAKAVSELRSACLG